MIDVDVFENLDAANTPAFLRRFLSRDRRTLCGIAIELLARGTPEATFSGKIVAAVNARYESARSEQERARLRDLARAVALYLAEIDDVGRRLRTMRAVAHAHAQIIRLLPAAEKAAR